MSCGLLLRTFGFAVLLVFRQGKCRTPPAYGRVIFARFFSFIINLCAARWAAGLLTLLVDENDIVASVSFDDLPYALGSA